MTRTSTAVVALLLGALLAAGCSTRPGTTATPDAPTARPTITPTAAPTSGPPTAELPGQSETGWGLIWDAIPESFPVPDEATPAEAEEGPVSGAWTVSVTAASAPDLAGFYRDALDSIGWGTGLDGPLEDGSYTVWSSNGYGCDTLTTILPRGDESLITVLFGAGCRFA